VREKVKIKRQDLSIVRGKVEIKRQTIVNSEEESEDKETVDRQ
jgi:DNA-binding XRE family transcriptional regulator